MKNYTQLPDDMLTDFIERRALDRLVVFFLGQCTVVCLTILFIHLFYKFVLKA